MVPVLSLWLSILIAAVLVFIASSILHMLLPYHRSDFKGLPSEDEISDALRPFGIPPGDYFLPHAADLKESGTPEFVEKYTRGPVALITILKPGPPAMGKSLAQWFVYCIVVSIFAAYIAGRALGPGVPYWSVFRFAGCTAFIGYSLALWQNTIWYKRAWSTTLKSTIDGFIYALLTAGSFAGFWPE